MKNSAQLKRRRARSATVRRLSQIHMTFASRIGLAALAGAILVVAVCDSTLAQSASGNQAPVSTRLGDGEWSFSVDRVWHPPGGGIPHTLSLPDSDFRPAVPVRQYRLVLSAGGTRIRVEGPEGPAMVGVLREGSDAAVFDLLEGVFAGGTFTVSEVGDSIRGELMVYGSGVLVVSCVRGKISPREDADGDHTASHRWVAYYRCSRRHHRRSPMHCARALSSTLRPQQKSLERTINDQCQAQTPACAPPLNPIVRRPGHAKTGKHRGVERGWLHRLDRSRNPFPCARWHFSRVQLAQRWASGARRCIPGCNCGARPRARGISPRHALADILCNSWQPDGGLLLQGRTCRLPCRDSDRRHFGILRTVLRASTSMCHDSVA